MNPDALRGWCGARPCAGLLGWVSPLPYGAKTMTLKYTHLGRALAYAMLLSAAPSVAQAEEQSRRAQAPAAAPVAPPPSGVKAVLTPDNRPGICSADDANCIYLTSRLHFDVGDYLSVQPQTPTGLHSLTSGVNARRARIGVLGKFMADWNYAFVE